MIPDHFLNGLSSFGFFKPENRQNAPNDLCGGGGKTRLYCCVGVSSIRDVCPSDESFVAQVRLYLTWEEDLATAGLADFAQKAKDSGEKYSLSHDEVARFEATPELMLPDITFFNAISVNAIDDCASIRIYPGVSKQVLLWNQGYHLKCREHYELHEFPFDNQALTIELRQDRGPSIEYFDLSVHAVLFHRPALEMAEWEVCQPLVERVNPKHKVTQVKLQVMRKSQYYMNNIVVMMLGITTLSLSTFVLEPEDVASRLGNILTLLLTSVAFKFVIGDSLPKVTYDTEMDSFLFRNMSILFLTAVLVCADTVFDRLKGTSEVPNYKKQAAEATFAFLVNIGLNGHWLCRARKLHTSRRTPTLNVIRDKNWYRCDYGNPFFLEPPVLSTGIAKKRTNSPMVSEKQLELVPAMVAKEGTKKF